jgi:hypothetical protein
MSNTEQQQAGDDDGSGQRGVRMAREHSMIRCQRPVQAGPYEGTSKNTCRRRCWAANAADTIGCVGAVRGIRNRTDVDTLALRLD